MYVLFPYGNTVVYFVNQCEAKRPQQRFLIREMTEPHAFRKSDFRESTVADQQVPQQSSFHEIEAGCRFEMGDENAFW